MMRTKHLTLTGGAAINAQGNDEGNIINGNDAANILDGANGDDNLSGDAGNDILIGGAGRDTLNAGVGADTLMGGSGGDTLTGGDGADTFYYGDWTHSSSSGGSDQVNDFQSGVDVLDLSSIDANIIGGADNDAFQYMGLNVLVNGEFSTRIAGQLAIEEYEIKPFNGTIGGRFVVADLDGDGTVDMRIQLLFSSIEVGDILL